MDATIPIQLVPLLEKFFHIGRTKYNGHIYDNVLNIFDDMSSEEQKELLRGTIGIFAILTTSFSNVRELIDEGNQTALLVHLKRIKGDVVVEEKKEEDDGGFIGDKAFMRLCIFMAAGMTVFTCVTIFKEAASGDPEAMSRAKFLINLFSLFTG